jgi:hypothetical protein
MRGPRTESLPQRPVPTRASTGHSSQVRPWSNLPARFLQLVEFECGLLECLSEDVLEVTDAGYQAADDIIAQGQQAVHLSRRGWPFLRRHHPPDSLPGRSKSPNVGAFRAIDSP